MWEEILNYLSKQKKMELISPSSRGHSFYIEEIKNEYIIIEFFSGNTLKLERQRFESAYNYLKENKGEWIKIGSSRIGSNQSTIEGRIKKEYNGKIKGQAIRMK